MHISFIEAVREYANGEWGRDFKSMREAEIALGDRLGDFAALDLVRRINVAIQALIDDGRSQRRSPMKKPEGAKKFPGAKVGSLVYSCSAIEDGVYRKVVIFVDEDEAIIAAPCSRAEEWQVFVSWGGDDDFLTLEEAVQHGSREDIAWHGRRAEFARRALDAVEEGAVLSEFEEGISDD